MYACVHVCVYVGMYICIQTCVYVCMHARMYVLYVSSVCLHARNEFMHVMRIMYAMHAWYRCVSVRKVCYAFVYVCM